MQSFLNSPQGQEWLKTTPLLEEISEWIKIIPIITPEDAETFTAMIKEKHQIQC